MASSDAPIVRELFIEELDEVHGGGPVEDLIRDLKEGLKNTTQACCEESNDTCCS